MKERGMTRHVRDRYRKHRKTTWGALLAAAAAATLAAVMPAIGADPVTYPPPSSPGNVLPVANSAGGDTFACSSVRQDGYEIDVNNPRSGTTTYTLGGKPVSLTLVVAKSPTSIKDKYFSFKLTGAAATHVAVKGGNHIALYTYSGSAFGPATADGYGSGTPGVDVDTDPTGGAGLHAPLQSDGTPYAVSYTTFCVDLAATISGTVYTDTNANGDRDSGETGIGGRTLTIEPDGGSQQSVQSQSNGSYSFTVPTGQNYTVCAAQIADQAQTEPTGAALCAGGVPVSSNAVDAGFRTLNLTTNQTADFGFTGGTTGKCDGTTVTAPTTGGGDYSATFVGGDKCTSTIDGKKLVFTTWQTSTNIFASLHPQNAPTQACLVTTEDHCVRVHETLVTRYAAGSDQKILKYDDVGPVYDPQEPMPFCKAAPDDSTALTAILPQRANDTYHTSCLVKSVAELVNDSGWLVKRTDTIFSAQDGNRGY